MGRFSSRMERIYEPRHVALNMGWTDGNSRNKAVTSLDPSFREALKDSRWRRLELTFQVRVGVMS